MCKRPLTTFRAGIWGWLCHKRSEMFSPRYRFLKRAIDEIRCDVPRCTAREPQSADPTVNDQEGGDFERINRLVAKAEEALLAGDIDGGWHFLNGAQRKLVCRSDKCKLLAVTSNLKNEIADAGKFPPSSWRRPAIKALIENIHNPNVKDDEIRLFAVSRG